MDRIDRMCIDTAIEHVLRRELSQGTLLMLNCEPLSAYVDPSRNPILARAHDEFQVVFELTERSLLTHPHALLKKVADLRTDGFGIALDDVGAHPDSLALLDVVCPDVVKLDLHLVQSQPNDDQARTCPRCLLTGNAPGQCCSPKASSPTSTTSRRWRWTPPWARATSSDAPNR
jgi:EAL domain-containing protein (putative c-di-GMP-specific phosphodiesterase class I)